MVDSQHTETLTAIRLKLELESFKVPNTSYIKIYQ